MAENPQLGYADVNVAQEERVNQPGDGQALAGAAEAVVGAVADAKTRGVAETLQTESDAFIQEALAKQRALDQPLTDDAIAKAIGADNEDLNTDEAKVIRPVLEQIAKLRLAEEQGAIDVSELKIRQENILRQAVARNPAFAGKFIQGAAQQLGYNPIGAQIDALTAAQRAKGHNPDDPRSYLEKQYDTLGEAMQLNPTLKLRDPVRWYSLIHKEATLREATANKKREVDLLVAQREFGTEKAKVALGSWWVGNSRQYINAALGAASQVARSTAGKGGADAIESGSLDAQRDAIRAAKARMITDAQSAMADYAQWIGPNEIQAAVQPVADMFDAAITATDPQKVLEGMKTIVESGVYRDVYLKYPGLAKIKPVAEIIGNLGNTPLAAKISQDLERMVAGGTVSMLGGIINDATQPWDEDGFPTSPATSVIPEVFKTGNKADAERATGMVITRVRDALVSSAKSPDPEVRSSARAAAFNIAGSFAQEYQGYLTRSNYATSPPKIVVDPWLDLMASNDYKDAMQDPRVPETTKANLKGVASQMLRTEWRVSVHEGAERATLTVPALTTNKRGVRLPFGSIMRFGWENNAVTIGVAPADELQAAGIQNVPVKAVNLAINKFKANGSLDRLTRLVRAKAHQDNESYEGALLELARDTATMLNAETDGG